MNMHVLAQAACQVCAKLDSPRSFALRLQDISTKHLDWGEAKPHPDVPGKVLVEIHPQ